MLTISKDANVNYLAKVVKLKNLQKHTNADRLQTTQIDFQTVITDLEAKEGDIYIYFPVECEINKDFISFINGFREKELNKDQTQAGFFEKNCRVRAVRLRGEKSMGFIVPAFKLEEFANVKITEIDNEFDVIGDILICKKYVVKTKNQPSQKGQKLKKERVSRIIDQLINLHVDTENLRKNIHKISPDDEISVSFKFHGTSFWVSHVKVKRKLNLFERLLKYLKVRIDEIEDDYVYGSRNVIKNEFFNSQPQHFYKVDIWGEIKDEVKESLPLGFTVYGEAVGYTSTGAMIQDGYDYGCKQGEKKVFIYRITFTNDRGYVYNLSTRAIIDFCNRYGLNHVPYFFIGKLKDLLPHIDTNLHFHENVIPELEKIYNLEDDCFICKNKVPREGIVIRKESQFDFDVYKLKGFRFLEKESKELDKGEPDMESEN
jgi:hypothetical protein